MRREHRRSVSRDQSCRRAARASRSCVPEMTGRALSAGVSLLQNRGMSETIWLPSLVLALHQNRHAPYSRFVQMATVRATAARRTAPLSSAGSCMIRPRLTFVTDARSAKVGELESLAVVPRFAGIFRSRMSSFESAVRSRWCGTNAVNPRSLHARRDSWRELAEAVRVSFTWPEPGEPAMRRVPFPSAHPDPETPLSHFCLLVLDPHEVDLLEINGNPQNRWIYQPATKRAAGEGPRSIRRRRSCSRACASDVISVVSAFSSCRPRCSRASCSRNAATPAVAIWASCSPVPPPTPTAPITCSSTTTVTPPEETS